MKVDLTTLVTESSNDASQNIDTLSTIDMLKVINEEDQKYHGVIFNGKTYVAISKNKRVLHKIEIRKKISKRDSTRSKPCTHYEKKTCENMPDVATFEIFERDLRIYLSVFFDKFAII